MNFNCLTLIKRTTTVSFYSNYYSNKLDRMELDYKYILWNNIKINLKG